MSTLKTNAITTVAGKPILNSTGSIIQVQYATSGFVNQTINSVTPVALSGLSVTVSLQRLSALEYDELRE